MDVQFGVRVLWPTTFSKEGPINASSPRALLMCDLASLLSEMRLNSPLALQPSCYQQNAVEVMLSDFRS